MQCLFAGIQESFGARCILARGICHGVSDRATSQFKLVQDINYPLRVIRGGGAGGAKEEAH